MAVDRTLHLFAEAAMGETSAYDNLSGDQTGAEQRTRRWYAHPREWAVVFRLEDPAIRERIAQFMERLVLNGYVGYDQSDRGTLESTLKLVRYDPSAVHTPCETGCSMTAYEAVKFATGVDCDTDYDEAINPETGLCKTRNPATGLCGDTYFKNRKVYPTGMNFHYYMTRVLPLSGVKVQVYTLPGSVGGTQRADFYPQDLYQCVQRVGSEDVYVRDGGRRIAYTMPRWQSGYFETPYEHIGITRREIDESPADLADYTVTVGGVRYYNEFGRAVDLFNARSDVDRSAGAAVPEDFDATDENGNTVLDAQGNPVRLGWKRIAPFNALTYEQIGRLEQNLTVSISSANAVGWLKPSTASGASPAAKACPINLKRGDLVLTRTVSAETESWLTGRLQNGTAVRVPAHSAVGHIAVWI